MKEKSIIKEKRQVNIAFSHILIQFVILIFYTLIWLNAPLFGMGALNIPYFLFMFIGACIGAIIVLYSKANPEIPIPKKPTQQFANLIKAMVDSITDKFIKQHPNDGLINLIEKALVQSIREAEISSEFDKIAIAEAKQYIADKLFPKDETDGEITS